jgi:hypothetical protein
VDHRPKRKWAEGGWAWGRISGSWIDLKVSIGNVGCVEESWSTLEKRV